MEGSWKIGAIFGAVFMGMGFSLARAVSRAELRKTTFSGTDSRVCWRHADVDRSCFALTYADDIRAFRRGAVE